MDKLPEELGELGCQINPREYQGDQLSPAEGHALRTFRALLFQNDSRRAFGGLRRVQAPAGELLWVCAHHYSEYDPGLPDIPTYY